MADNVTAEDLRLSGWGVYQEEEDGTWSVGFAWQAGYLYQARDGGYETRAQAEAALLAGAGRLWGADDLLPLI